MAVFFSLILFFSGTAMAEAVPQWSPHSLSLSCGEKACPHGIGMVLFPEWKPKEKRYLVTVCAASLITPNQILTANHCVRPDVNRAQFVLVGGNKNSMHPLSRVVFQKAGIDPVIRYGPDTAILELKNRISDVEPLKLASLNSPEPTRLVGFLLDQVGNDGFHFRFDEKFCDVPEEFPFPLRLHPEAYKLLNCPADYGNSGSPLFSLGDLEHIQAIMLDKTKTRDSVVSNIRCLHLTASGADISGCQAPDMTLLGQVTNALWEKRADRFFANWVGKDKLPADIKWKPIRFQIGQGAYIEIPWPACRTQSISKSGNWEMSLPFEVIKVVVDPAKGPQLSEAGRYKWKMSGLRADNGQDVFRAILPDPKPWPTPPEFAQFKGSDYFPLRSCGGASAAH